jgi:hypothetical protein
MTGSFLQHTNYDSSIFLYGVLYQALLYGIRYTGGITIVLPNYPVPTQINDI